METNENESEQPEDQERRKVSRRNFLAGGAAFGGVVLWGAAAAPSSSAAGAPPVGGAPPILNTSPIPPIIPGPTGTGISVSGPFVDTPPDSPPTGASGGYKGQKDVENDTPSNRGHHHHHHHHDEADEHYPRSNGTGLDSGGFFSFIRPFSFRFQNDNDLG